MSAYDDGKKTIETLNPGAGAEMEAFLKTIAPDFAELFFKFPFGSLYSRKELDLRSREIATIAALVTKGTAPSELKTHIQCGLNVGLTRQEIVEIIMQMSVYAGFPEAIAGLEVAKKTFETLDQDDHSSSSQ